MLDLYCLCFGCVLPVLDVFGLCSTCVSCVGVVIWLIKGVDRDVLQSRLSGSCQRSPYGVLCSNQYWGRAGHVPAAFWFCCSCGSTSCACARVELGVFNRGA